MCHGQSIRAVVAVLGGHPRHHRELPRGWRHYPCRKEGGRRAALRLVASIKHGHVRLVLILARANAHSQTRRVRTVCKAAGVPVRVIDRRTLQASRRHP